MIVLTQGQAEIIILTLNEKKTLEAPTYTIICTNVTTNEKVSFPLGVDSSLYKDRFNAFEITADKFLSATPGQWMYLVTEDLTGVEVERGKLLLNKAIDFNFTGYGPETTYSGYRG